MLLLRLRCATLVSVSYSNHWIWIDYQLIETFFNYSKAINWQEFWNFFKWQGMEFFLWFLFVLLVNDIVYAWILFWNFHLINVNWVAILFERGYIQQKRVKVIYYLETIWLLCRVLCEILIATTSVCIIFMDLTPGYKWE